MLTFFSIKEMQMNEQARQKKIDGEQNWAEDINEAISKDIDKKIKMMMDILNNSKNSITLEYLTGRHIANVLLKI
mgnify:CR=1 FL=1